ncbi:MAG: CHASE3 domain-containing protein [Steroidobacteraceae bacterium]
MRPIAGTRLIYAPILLGVVLITSIFLVAETGHSRLRTSAAIITTSQQRQGQLSRYLQLMLAAESAQRGFLLTEDSRYLKRFDPTVRELDPLLDAIRQGYERTGREEELRKAEQMRKLTGVRLGEMLGSLRLYGENNLDAALALINTDIGEKAMSDLRRVIDELYAAEGARLDSAAAGWRRDLRTSRALLAAATALSLLLVIWIGTLIARDVRHRMRQSQELNERNKELDELVKRRTTALFDLSSNLQKITEREKASLARELHDELGGLLVATKIDVSLLRRSLGDPDEATAIRWNRVLGALDAGLRIKRRVIESLRPTLLDNVGLVAALRWLMDESCRRAGMGCEEVYLEPLPELSPDASIAVFRVVQESLVNVMKHAKAKSIHLAVQSDPRNLSVTIRDDGTGIDEERLDIPRAHGIRGMRHRIEALGGRLQIRSVGKGTEVAFSLPWERIRKEPVADVTA